MARRYTSAIAIGFVLVLGPHSPLLAQGPRLTEPLPIGTVVRLHFADTSLAAGRLLAPFAADSTTFVYCPYHTDFCAGPSLRRIETSASKVQAVDVKGGPPLLRDVLGGAAIAEATWYVTCRAESWASSGFCSSHDLANGGPVALVSGAALGALIGLLTTHWRPAR